jgi:hypothetical protein
VEIVNHISEEALAQYARWSLPRLKIRLVEEHRVRDKSVKVKRPPGG